MLMVATAAIIAEVGGGTSGYLTWAPLLVAGTGLMAAFVTGFSRRDQRLLNQANLMDARTNTALKALSESLATRDIDLDKAVKERDEWRNRAEAAEERLEDVMAQLVEAKARLTTTRKRA